MNIIKIEKNKSYDTIIYFLGLNQQIDDIKNILFENKNSIIFQYPIELFYSDFQIVVDITRNNLINIINDHMLTELILCCISIGGLILTNIYDYVVKTIKKIILLDTTNITSIPYLLSQNKKNNKINYNSIIDNIYHTQYIKFNSITVSHINLSHNLQNNTNKKYLYFLNLSVNSQVIVHNKTHNLHIDVPELIRTSFYD